jgi:hypothetical protein
MILGDDIATKKKPYHAAEWISADADPQRAPRQGFVTGEPAKKRV